MTDARRGPTISVSSLFYNLERLFVEAAPGREPTALGQRFSFGLPDLRTCALTEYSLPCGPVPLPEILAQRAGVRIRTFGGADSPDLHQHLDLGAPAIVAVDSFYLPYRPAYGRVHSSRTIVVRPGGPGRVIVDDPWLPAYVGPLATDDLERARRSMVPLAPELEPIFAGLPIGGQWWTLELVEPRGGDDAWLERQLSLLSGEAWSSRSDAGLATGFAGWHRFQELVTKVIGWPDASRRHLCRRASLLLRSELSVRAYLNAFLRQAAARLGDALLAAEARRHHTALVAMQSARDVLAKSVTHWRPAHAEIAGSQLAAVAAAERRLAEALLPYGAARHAGSLDA